METKQQVHIGPISIFTLVVSLCMAVLAVLAISTSNAMYALSSRAANTTTQIYEAEVAGQRLLAELDAALQAAREAGQDVHASVEASLDDICRAAAAEADPLGLASFEEQLQVTAQLVEDQVLASVVTPEARRLDMVVRVNADGSYQVLEWKLTSEVDSSGTGDTLWSPLG